MGLFGTECRKCEALGITCTQNGVLRVSDSREPKATSTIHTDDRNVPILRTTESIEQCPANTGKSTNEQVANNIKEIAKTIKPLIVRPYLNGRNSNVLVFP